MCSSPAGIGKLILIYCHHEEINRYEVKGKTLEIHMLKTFDLHEGPR